jgi:hypothetical protein
MNADFNSRFANQNELLSALNNSLSPIVAAGPNQQGFSAAESAALNTQAINSSAAGARNARQASGNFSAGQGGGGTSGLQSGVTKQINAAIDSSATNSLATAQNQITQANYAQGSQNYWRAQGGLNALAGQENPEAFGNLSVGSNSSAFNEANQVQQQKNQEEAAIAGGITSLAVPFISGGIGGLGPGGEGNTNFSDFFKGGLSALGG